MVDMIRKALFTTTVFCLAAISHAVEPIDFNRDIRPILSDKCFHCHGPDAKNQKSDYRLDTEENLFADLGGYFGVVPGNLEDSELHYRLHTDDPVEVMPPPDANRDLTKTQKDLLDRWIKEGAVYDKHWSFKKVERPEVPQVQAVEWCRNPIDHFIMQRLESEGLQPSADASPETLFRRASLLLTGLQPESANAPAGQEAYLAELDRLFQTSDYAERQTLKWLDAARYADTDGYQVDRERSNWPWRDWVIRAFRENKPFDQFTIEQIAGDMIPEATEDQILATTFNRNHRQNAEGGALAEEFFVENVIDRVETTFTVWQGLTMGCARCHDHKYDPLSQKEFFQMYAYFNNIGENGTGQGTRANPVQDFASPLVEVPAEYVTRRAEAAKQLADAKKGLGKRREDWIASVLADIDKPKDKAWPKLKPISAKATGGKLVIQPDGTLFHTGKVGSVSYTIDWQADSELPVAAVRIDGLKDPSFTQQVGFSKSSNGNVVMTEVTLKHNGQEVPLVRAQATYSQKNFPAKNLVDGNRKTGWAIHAIPDEVASAAVYPGAPIMPKQGDAFQITLRFESPYGNHNFGKLRLGSTDNQLAALEKAGRLDAKLLAAIKLPKEKRNRGQSRQISDYFNTIDQPVMQAQKKADQIEKEMTAKGYGMVPVMVMKERAGDRMPAYLLNRGSYLEPQKDEPMQRLVPAALFYGNEDQQPKDRLELAKWMASGENPLTARVYVNRIWQSIFRTGIVKTVEDFGLQSEMPSHPELLDWLAAEFVESGWDVQHMYRLILSSRTFQQSSEVTADLLEQDPENRLLARGPRFRMDGFAIRDMALKSSGLLDPRIGGKPVKPYQPEGLWNAVSSGAGDRYRPSQGADLYRKSMYTYWKRAVNPPRQTIFDSGGREACDVNSRVTNTPLQALVLMNDVTFLEAARHLAQQSMQTHSQPSERIGAIYSSATSRQIGEKTQQILAENLQWFIDHYTKHPEEAAKFLAAGESPRDDSIAAEEHAAYMAVAHLVLNLDETITLE